MSKRLPNSRPGTADNEVSQFDSETQANSRSTADGDSYGFAPPDQPKEDPPLFILRKNSKNDAAKLKHENSGALSFYFQQVAKSKPGEVVTPDVLAQAIEEDRDTLDKKMVRKDGKKAFKEALKSANKDSRRDGVPNKKESFSTRPGKKDYRK